MIEGPFEESGDTDAGGGLEEESSGASGLRSYEHRALGTWNFLMLDDLDPGDPQATDSAAASAFRLLDRLEDELSRFRPESEVSLLNSLGSGRAVPVGRTLLDVLRLAREAWRDTDGAFDPTVGPLLDAWGFPAGPGRVPSEDELERLMAKGGMQHVLIDDAARTVLFDRTGVSLDLGAIGKGYAVDRVADMLEGKGVVSGVVLSGTSSIRCWGQPPEGGPYRLEVAHPIKTDETIRHIEVEPGAISTSANSQEKFEIDGVEYGHILDPRTGRPVRSVMRSVTIWTEGAARGDAISTALFVLDRDGRSALFDRLRAKGERVSAMIIEEDRQEWGGLAVSLTHTGEPAMFEVAGD